MTTFAGRRAELADLDRALADALVRRTRTCVVTGEPGIGKTTLVEEFAARAQRRGAVAAWAQCSEVGGAPPFWPWVQILRRLTDEQTLSALDDAAREAVRRLLSDPTAPVIEGTSREGSDEARFALFDALARAFAAAAELRPRLIVIEDCHAADIASVQFLRFAATHLRDARCLILVTYREHEAAAREEIADLLRVMPADVVRLGLTGLPPDDLSVLLESLAGRAASPVALTALHETTAGNPFFAESLVRMLAREDRLDDLDAGDLAPLPSTVVEVIARRVARLPDDVREVLTLLATAGREFDRRFASVLAQELGRADRAIELGLRDRLVEPLDEAGARYRFVHALVPAALVDALPIGEREAAHARVARSLVSLYGDDPEPPLADLAHHFARAGREHAAEASEYARAAGDRATRVLAYEDAASLYEDAIEAGGDARAAEAEIDVRLKAGQARIWAGDLERGRAHAERAWELADRIGSAEDLARAALVYGSEGYAAGLVNETTVRMIGGALARLGDSAPPLRAVLRARLATELTYSMAADAVELMMGEALAEARETGDPQILMRTLAFVVSAGSRPEHTARELAWCTEMIELARSLDDRVTLADALTRRSIFQMALGRPEEYAADVAAARQTAHGIASPLRQWRLIVATGCEALMAGDFARADELANETLAFAQEVEPAIASWQFQRFMIAWETGGVEEFEPFLSAMTTMRPGIAPMARSAIMLILSETGRHEEARAGLLELARDVSSRTLPWVWPISIGWLADTAVRIGDQAAALVIRDGLERFAELQIVGPTGAVAAYWGSFRRPLANLSYLLGDLDRAVAEGERAIAEHVRMGAPTFVARSQFELARTLLARGRGEDVARAAVLLREAEAAADRMGMLRLRALIDEVEHPVVPAAIPVDHGPRISLEGEYWTITHDGTVTRLRDAKGLRYLVALLEHPGKEIHALDLIGGKHAPARAAAVDDDLRTDAGGADPVLDERARAAYQRRIRDLESEIEEATEAMDSGRAERLRAERDFVVDELKRALGLGGRARRLGPVPAEQARVAVTKGIRSALRKIDTSDPALGRHLRATIRTGTFCSYSDHVEPLLEWSIDAR